MTKVNDGSPAGEHGAWLRGAKKIAVFRALQLGDLLCIVPALRSLRAAAPQAHITLIGLPWAAMFVKRFHRYVDAHIEFPGFPGLPEREPQLDALPGFLARMHAENFDVAIQMHGSGGLSNPLMGAFGARINAGHYAHGQWCPDAERFAPWQGDEHEILRYLDLMEFLGIETMGDTLEFPLTDDDFQRLRTAVPELSSLYAESKKTGLVCIHPGAQLPSRRWLPERFAAVADGLHAAGHRIAITGTEGERDITAAVLRSMQAPAIDLTGRTDLGTLAALIAQAQLVVCNDTGVSHVATAVATPTVIVSSGASPERWAPLNRIRHRLLCEDVPCRPCMHRVCPIDHPCATRVSADMVLMAAFSVLSNNPPRLSSDADEHPAQRRRQARRNGRRQAQA